MTTSTT